MERDINFRPIFDESMVELEKFKGKRPIELLFTIYQMDDTSFTVEAVINDEQVVIMPKPQFCFSYYESADNLLIQFDRKIYEYFYENPDAFANADAVMFALYDGMLFYVKEPSIDYQSVYFETDPNRRCERIGYWRNGRSEDLSKKVKDDEDYPQGFD